MRIFILSIATGLFTGYIPIFPGTIATLLGCLLWIILSKGSFYYLYTGIIVISGIFVSDYAGERVFFEKDSKKIVIDEIAGILITFLTFKFTVNTLTFFYLGTGFILFRAFDILKPVPIKGIQRVGGGMGVMLDDILAGIFSNTILQIIRIVTLKIMT